MVVRGQYTLEAGPYVFSGNEDEPTRVSVRHENRKTALTPRSRPSRVEPAV